MTEKPKSTTGLLWRLEDLIEESWDNSTFINGKMYLMISLDKLNSAMDKTDEDILNALDHERDYE